MTNTFAISAGSNTSKGEPVLSGNNLESYGLFLLVVFFNTSTKMRPSE